MSCYVSWWFMCTIALPFIELFVMQIVCVMYHMWSHLARKSLTSISFVLLVGGLLMELPSAWFASSKCTRMENTVTPVLTPKVLFLIVDLAGLLPLVIAGKSNVFDVMQEFARCAVSKYSTPSSTSKAMYNASQMLLVGIVYLVCWLIAKLLIHIFGPSSLDPWSSNQSIPYL